ncbi:threonine aldolase family protein [Phenylobacterium sp. VNQ135]|uniref:threonine aldolase family protein n=1 Tax=Phenylobacterium sp. VNQ135 TaxID=3400922 RepID=UPI003C0EF5A3
MDTLLYSDNTVPIAPEILEAIVAANAGHVRGYGDDHWSAAARQAFAAFFEREVEVSLVATGTAANALALASVCPPYGAVICSDLAHIHTEECGAPEMFTAGCKMLPIPTAGTARLTAQAVADTIAASGVGLSKCAQASMVSLSQCTERGGVYSLDEVRAIADAAHARGLKVHMDGARLGCALASLRCSPAEATWRAGVDVLSFGATKSGAMAAEAVVYFDPEAAAAARYRQKRAGQTPSKMRYFAVQWSAYLGDDLWLRHARHANAAAADLAVRLAALPGVSLAAPVEANEVFVRLPPRAVQAAATAPGEAVFRVAADVLRFVTAWDTGPQHIAAAVARVRSSLGGADA